MSTTWSDIQILGRPNYTAVTGKSAVWTPVFPLTVTGYLGFGQGGFGQGGFGGTIISAQAPQPVWVPETSK